MKTLLLAALLSLPIASLAQSAKPPVYEFLTVVDSEAQGSSWAKLLFAPAFQGKSQVQLEHLPGTTSGDKYLAVQQQNLQLVNQYLGEVTAAGWELVHVFGGEMKTSYLFRKEKR